MLHSVMYELTFLMELILLICHQLVRSSDLLHPEINKEGTPGYQNKIFPSYNLFCPTDIIL